MILKPLTNQGTGKKTIKKSTTSYYTSGGLLKPLTGKNAVQLPKVTQPKIETNIVQPKQTPIQKVQTAISNVPSAISEAKTKIGSFLKNLQTKTPGYKAVQEKLNQSTPIQTPTITKPEKVEISKVNKVISPITKNPLISQTATLTPEAKFRFSPEGTKIVRQQNKEEIQKATRTELKKGYKEPGAFGQAVESVKQATIGLIGSLGASSEMIGQLTGNILLTSAGQKINTKANKIIASNPEWEAPKDQKWGKEKIARLVAGSVPSVLGGIAAGIVGGPVGLYAYGFGSEAGTTYQEAIDAGTSEGKSQIYSIVVGSINGALETIFPDEFLSAGKKIVKDKIKKTLVKQIVDKAKDFGIKFAKNGFKEGTPEALQQLVSNTVATNYDKNRKLWDGVLESFIGGALTGGLIGQFEGKVSYPNQNEFTPDDVQDSLINSTLLDTEESTKVQDIVKKAKDSNTQIIVSTDGKGDVIITTPEGDKVGLSIKEVSKSNQLTAPVSLLVSHEGAPDKVTVAEYKTKIQNGETIEPIKVIREGTKYGIEDGKHRFQAYQELGIKDVPIEIVEARKLVKKTKEEPITLYHGTNKIFDKFDVTKSGDVQVSDWGDGVYFTDKKEVAKGFAKVAGGEIVMERYTPDVKYADASKLVKDSDFMNALDDEMGFTTPAEYLQEKGFGGIKIHHKEDGGWNEYVVFDPKDIKNKEELHQSQISPESKGKPLTIKEAELIKEEAIGKAEVATEQRATVNENNIALAKRLVNSKAYQENDIEFVRKRLSIEQNQRIDDIVENSRNINGQEMTETEAIEYMAGLPTKAETKVKLPEKYKTFVKKRKKTQLSQDNKILKSRVFERMKEEFGLDGDAEISAVNLEKDADRAVRLIEKNKQKAFNIAMGFETSDKILSSSVNIAFFEKAMRDGNIELANRLIKNRSLAQTRRGQEIVAEKGSISDNSTSKYVKELISARLDKLGKNYLSEIKESSNKEKAVKLIDSKVTTLENKIKNKKLSVKDALLLLDKLKCI